MNQLFNHGQVFSVVPMDPKFANKGKIVQILERCIVLELEKPPTGLQKLKINEFYSQTRQGMLYFNSSIAMIDENKNTIVVMKPKKHRFLQRRAYTRVKYIQQVVFKDGDNYVEGTTVDLAAGGIKAKTNEGLVLDKVYELRLPLEGGDDIVCNYQPIKMEKIEDENLYISAGKLIDIAQRDKMRIMQYCLRKDIEYNKR